MNAVECQNLTKTFSKHKAIQDLSIELNSNKIIGLIGRNGAGKTTLLKMIAGHYKADHGDIQVFSETPFNNLKIAANTMFIEDDFNLPQSLNLEDIISSVSSFYSNWDNQLALELMDYFQLPQHKSYTKLSRGMKSTFNSILGLASRCPLTILDEQWMHPSEMIFTGPY